jgi:hypothetical protein
VYTRTTLFLLTARISVVPTLAFINFAPNFALLMVCKFKLLLIMQLTDRSDWFDLNDKAFQMKKIRSSLTVRKTIRKIEDSFSDVNSCDLSAAGDRLSTIR